MIASDRNERKGRRIIAEVWSNRDDMSGVAARFDDVRIYNSALWGKQGP